MLTVPLEARPDFRRNESKAKPFEGDKLAQYGREDSRASRRTIGPQLCQGDGRYSRPTIRPA